MQVKDSNVVIITTVKYNHSKIDLKKIIKKLRLGLPNIQNFQLICQYFLELLCVPTTHILSGRT